MKKLSVILLALLYLSVNIPAEVSLHYCAGELSGIDFSLNQAEKSCVCGKAESKSCCNDKLIVFKAADTHNNVLGVSINYPIFDSFFSAEFPVYKIQEPAVKIPVAFAEYKSPPPGKKPIYILNQVFII